MVDRDVLIQKINSIQNCLKRIYDTTAHTPYSLDDLDVQDIVVLNLQRAVQLVIDMAFHVISEERLGIPQNLKESFQQLEKNRIISPKVSCNMQKMVGFRNIAVHEYHLIDTQILQKIIDCHLGDIEEFYTEILHHFRK